MDANLEKKILREMIGLYCGKTTKPKPSARTAPGWKPTPWIELKNAPSVRPKPSAPPARSTATGRKCARKSGR